MAGAGEIRIGTAGWSVPKALAADFPAAGSHLERYGAVMTAAEINSSFCRPHRRATYERWAAATPADFRFSVKLPRAISHDRKLADTDAPLDAFIEQVGGLGGKLGVILVQLPPSLAFDRGVASAFLAALRKRLAPYIGIACEPRHASWFTAAADACLAGHRVARVAADPVLAAGGEAPGGWAGLRYHRLHGSPRVYYSPYAAPALAALADAIAGDRLAGVASWCIFDNTASGAALGDALQLQSLLRSASRARP